MEHSVVVHAETTMDAAALGLKRIREQQFVIEDLADPVTVELVTSTSAQGVAQESDGVDVARRREESP